MEFRKAEKKDEHCNAELLAESFIDYPLFTVIENDKNRRKKLIYEFQYINTMLFVQKHCCFIAIENQHIIGVALLKSLKGKQDFLSYLRFGLARLIRKGMLLKALKYLKLVTSTNDTLHKRSNNGWYLDSLAISKEVQGKGMGSTILKGCIYPYISKEGGRGSTIGNQYGNE